MTNTLLYIAIGVITTCTLTALLASAADIYARRRYRLLSQSKSIRVPTKSTRPLTILLFHTSLPATLTTLRHLKKIHHVTLRIVIVSNGPARSSLSYLRKYLKRRKSLDVRLYSTRLPATRESALRKAYRYAAAGSPIFIIDNGDVITAQTLQSTVYLAETHRLSRIHLARQISAGVSFYEHTVALLAAATQLIERVHQLLPYSIHHLPSGTFLRTPKKITTHGVYLSRFSIAGPNLLTTKRITTLLSLTATSLILLGMLSFSAFHAALLHTTQPLLSFLLVAAFVTFVIASWSQATHTKDKWQLYAFAPISGIVLPIGLTILSGYELSGRLFRFLEGRYIRRNANRSRNQRNILNNILPLKARH